MQVSPSSYVTKICKYDLNLQNKCRRDMHLGKFIADHPPTSCVPETCGRSFSWHYT